MNKTKQKIGKNNEKGKKLIECGQILRDRIGTEEEKQQGLKEI